MIMGVLVKPLEEVPTITNNAISFFYNISIQSYFVLKLLCIRHYGDFKYFLFANLCQNKRKVKTNLSESKWCSSINKISDNVEKSQQKGTRMTIFDNFLRITLSTSTENNVYHDNVPLRNLVYRNMKISYFNAFLKANQIPIIWSC